MASWARRVLLVARYVAIGVGLLGGPSFHAEAFAQDTFTYRYDELGRLVSTTYPNNIGNAYRYDAAGNRIEVSGGPTGSMSVGSSKTITFTAAGQAARITFNATAGDRVGLATWFATAGMAACSARVIILNPDGVAKVYDKPFCSQTDVSGDLLLTVTGTYTIVLTLPATKTGTVTLILSPTLQPSITVGGAAVAPLVLAGQNARLTFSATAGDRIGFAFSGENGQCARVIVLAPGGTTPVNVLPCGWYVSGDLLLPTTGSYLITYNTVNVATGTMTFTLSPTVQGSITVGGSPVPITPLSQVGQNARLSFSATAGDRLGLVITGGAKCTNNRIVTPGGTNLFTSQTCGNSNSGDVLMPATGTYALVLNAQDRTTGAITVALVPTVLGSITIGGGAVPITLSEPGQNASLTFSATAGDRVGLAVVGAGGQCANVRIVTPTGSNALNTNVCGTGLSGDVPLPATGTYTIAYKPSNAATGTVNFTLSATNSAATTIGGSSVPFSPTLAGQVMEVTFPGTASGTAKVSIAASSPYASSCYAVRTLKPDGSTLATTSSQCGTNYNTGVLTLPQTGTYKSQIYGVGSGSVTVTVTPS